LTLQIDRLVVDRFTAADFLVPRELQLRYGLDTAQVLGGCGTVCHLALWSRVSMRCHFLPLHWLRLASQLPRDAAPALPPFVTGSASLRFSGPQRAPLRLYVLYSCRAAAVEAAPPVLSACRTLGPRPPEAATADV